MMRPGVGHGKEQQTAAEVVDVEPEPVEGIRKSTPGPRSFGTTTNSLYSAQIN